jgi:hypothetical protein
MAGGFGDPAGDDPIAGRFTGRTWSPAAFHGGFVTGNLQSVSASDNDAWAFGTFYTSADPTATAATLALHWSGSQWVVARNLPGSLSAGLALSNQEVWVFTDGGVAWHLRAGRWNRLRPGFTIFRATALSATDVWAVGQRTVKGKQINLVARWDGHNWRVVKTVVPAGDIAAASDHDVWAVGRHAIHWDGHGWHSTALPRGGAALTRVVPDGNGGAWAISPLATACQLLHYTRGRWSCASVPKVNTLLDTVLLTSLARVPGTTSVWAAGSVTDSSGQCDCFSGVILKYGR